ncbi:MAG: transposase [Xanthomonadales bacterium]|nr:transposase [Xanthomonadales bacterium]
MLQLQPQTITGQAVSALNRPKCSGRPGELSWVTLSTVNNKNWFTHPLLARSTASSLHHSLADTNAQILVWVLLPEQLHLLIQAGSNCNVADAMQRVKARTAIAANQAATTSTGMVGPLWKIRYSLQTVYQRQHAHELAKQIISQPQQLGLVDHYANYPYWDSIWV